MPILARFPFAAPDGKPVETPASHLAAFLNSARFHRLLQQRAVLEARHTYNIFMAGEPEYSSINHIKVMVIERWQNGGKPHLASRQGRLIMAGEAHA
jgi:hypothetical protein